MRAGSSGRYTRGMARVIDDDAGLKALLARTKRIAVLGIKPETRGGEAAFYVPEYLAEQGFDVVPVPVYYPEVTRILGRPVVRSLDAVPKPIDLVNVFRRSADVAGHLDELLRAAPRAVWMQSGIRNDAVAKALVDAGIDVVMNRCLLVEHQRLVRGED